MLKTITSENMAQIAERGDAARELIKGIVNALLTGCPLLAFPTTSAASVRIVFMARSSAEKGEKPAIVRNDLQRRMRRRMDRTVLLLVGPVGLHDPRESPFNPRRVT